MAESVKIRVVIPHQHVGGCPDYHKWIAPERVQCNRLGVPNPRMWLRLWTKWICNNTDCPAFAFVSDDAISDLIEGVSNA